MAHFVRGSVSRTICSTRALLCCTSLLCSSSISFCSCKNVPASQCLSNTCHWVWGRTDMAMPPGKHWCLAGRPQVACG